MAILMLKKERFSHFWHQRPTMSYASCCSSGFKRLITLPVDWDYHIPYGLLYSLNPSESVRQFVDVVKQLKLTSVTKNPPIYQ